MFRFIASMLALVCLSLASPPPVAASTVRWTSANVAPQQVTLRCKYQDKITDVQTRDSIARRYGLVGKVQEVTDKMSAMRSAGYRVSGARGSERLEVEVPFSGVFEQPVKFSTRVTNVQAYLFARFPQGRGKIVANNRVKRYLTNENRRYIENTYRGWSERFNGEMQRMERKFGEYVFPLNDSERPDLSRAMRGSVSKGINDFGICETRYDVRVKAVWERSVARGLGQ